MAAEPTRALGVILVYHRVDARTQDLFHLGVAPARFRAHLEIVQRRFRPVSLEDIGTPSESGNVAVTFDDGYANNLEVASELLLERGIPATFFVNSGALDAADERFWDQLERVVFEARQPALRLGVAGQSFEWGIRTEAERVLAFREVHELLMRADAATRDGIMTKVVEWGGGPRPRRDELRSLTARELIELAARPGHSIGAHGESHLLLPAHPPEVQRSEMVNDKRRLEAVLGREVRCFAYPFGASDSVSEAAAREAGFALAVRCEPRPVSEDADRWALPRLDAASLDGPELERKLAAFFQ